MGKGNRLCIKDYLDRKVIFTNQQFELKSPLRPELKEDGIMERIREAVENPTFIYEDLEHKKRFAYYRREYKINNRTRYIKVILQMQNSCLFVVTAFRPDYVKERGKTKLLYGEDNE